MLTYDREKYGLFKMRLKPGECRTCKYTGQIYANRGRRTIEVIILTPKEFKAPNG